MKKTLFVIGLIICFTAVLSVGVFAEEPFVSLEEQAMIKATAMLVDESNNSITFISPEKIDDVNVNVYENLTMFQKTRGMNHSFRTWCN